LSQVDKLYGRVISKLPDANRIDYCESLVYRTEKDVAETRCKVKKRKLKKLLHAARLERKNLMS